MVFMKMQNLIPINVECYSGYKADEYPTCFCHEGIKYEITEITDRWYQSDKNPEWPVSDYFKVKTACGKLFIIKHDLDNDLWNLLL
jgi:hypothetical protein